MLCRLKWFIVFVANQNQASITIIVNIMIINIIVIVVVVVIVCFILVVHKTDMILQWTVTCGEESLCNKEGTVYKFICLDKCCVRLP